jgi:hypothetical protein
VRFPWEPGGSGLTLFNWLHRSRCCKSCGTPNCLGGAQCACYRPTCGDVRCVRILESEDYEVKRCACKWKIRRLPPCEPCAEAVLSLPESTH